MAEAGGTHEEVVGRGAEGRGPPREARRQGGEVRLAHAAASRARQNSAGGCARRGAARLRGDRASRPRGLCGARTPPRALDCEHRVAVQLHAAFDGEHEDTAVLGGRGVRSQVTRAGRNPTLSQPAQTAATPPHAV